MKIAVIGCGVMGGALARHFAKGHTLVLTDKDKKKGKGLAEEIKGAFVDEPKQAIHGAEKIILAIKPKDLKELSSSLAPYLTKDQMVISILAGTPLSSLRKYFPETDLVRVMPNLALTVGEGVIGLAVEDAFKKKDEVCSLFQGLGLLIWLSDAKMEALTALSASSPACLFVIIEAMIEAGVEMGFSASEAKDIVLQTIAGAVTLLAKSGEHPAALKLQVASPAGTTIAALRELEERALRPAIWNALLAAYHRGLALVKETGVP